MTLLFQGYCGTSMATVWQALRVSAGILDIHRARQESWTSTWGRAGILNIHIGKDRNPGHPQGGLESWTSTKGGEVRGPTSGLVLSFPLATSHQSELSSSEHLPLYSGVPYHTVSMLNKGGKIVPKNTLFTSEVIQVSDLSTIPPRSIQQI